LSADWASPLWNCATYGINISINQTTVYFMVPPKVDQRDGQLSLPHVGITKTEKNRVSVYFRCATIDLMLIQQNKFYVISDRSMVAHPK